MRGSGARKASGNAQLGLRHNELQGPGLQELHTAPSPNYGANLT